MLGVGVSTNRVQAFKWLTFAATQGQKDSQGLLPDMKARMSSDELSQATHLVSASGQSGQSSTTQSAK